MNEEIHDFNQWIDNMGIKVNTSTFSAELEVFERLYDLIVDTRGIVLK